MQVLGGGEGGKVYGDSDVPAAEAAPLGIRGVSQCVQTALTKRHRLGGLSNTHLLLTVLEAGSPRSRCQQIWCLVRLPPGS